MILKLIKTNDTPKIGDLVKDKISNDLIIICSNEHCYDLEGSVTVVKPYGVSDEDLKEWDLVYDAVPKLVYQLAGKNAHLVERYNKYKGWYSKVVIRPEQFNYQEIVDLGLKDGDELKLKTKKTAILHERVQRKGYSEKSDITGYVDTIKWENGKVSITKPYVDDRYNRISKPSRSKPTPVTYTETEVKELYECLEELAELMQGVIDGEYKPDSFTTQPAIKVLANFKKK
jgi:hypothetical protein